MKKNVKMSRSVAALEGLFNHINSDFFGNSLPTPIITIQSKPGTYGHCSIRKIWEREDEYTYELNVAAEALKEDVEEIIDTMIHEMIHLFCRENEIKEVSRGGAYHNSKFREEAEKRMLKCTYTERYGWNTVGRGNDKLIEYALSIQFFGIEIRRTNQQRKIELPNGEIKIEAQNGERRPSSTRKYECPKCRTSFRATKCLTGQVMCMKCMELFKEVEK